MIGASVSFDAVAAGACRFAPVAAGVVLAFLSGGYFIRDWGVASLVLLALLAAAACALPLSFGGASSLIAIVALVSLAALQGISSVWSYAPSASLEAMNLTILYTAAFTLVLLGVRRGADLAWLLAAAMGGSAAVACYALTTRLLPALASGDDHPRLAAPITYWNALGAIAAFGAIIAVGLSGHPSRPAWLRGTAGGLIPMFLVTLLLTYSRGAALVLILAWVMLLALAPARLETSWSLIASVSLTVPLLLAVNGDDSLAALSGELPPHDDAGRRVAVLLLATMLASSLACAVGPRVLMRLAPLRRRTVGIAVISCAVTTLAAVAVANMPAGGPFAWADRQFESFRSFDGGARADAETVADRLAVAAGSGRWQNWEVAVDQYSTSPIVGTGAGDYERFWEAERDIDLTVTNAHSLYLEVLAETGIAGLALLLSPLAIAAWVILRSLRARPGLEQGRDIAIATCAAALVAIHAGGDWDWQLPAVILPALALGAGALKAAGLAARTESPGMGIPVAVAAAALALTAAVLVVGPTFGDRTMLAANRVAAEGRLEAALQLSERAHQQMPLDPAPLLLAGNLLTDLDRTADANSAFAAAARRAPFDWEIFADWTVALRRQGDRDGARAALERAVSLNPREPRVRYLTEADQT